MPERKLTVKIIGDATSLQRSFSTASRSTRQFSKELSRAERGVLAGSGVFRSLGRSLAFASGGFLAFGGAAAFIRKSVDAAKEAQVANAQLATQLRNNGKSFADYADQIDHTIFRLSALAGIQDDELKAGLTTILRTTPNVSKALRDLGTAADLARAKHISLGAAATIIAKTEAGNTTLLRRQGFQIAKNATAERALATVRAVVAGQARAGTTEQERFGAVLHQTEEIIGTGVLPTLNKYLVSGTKWLEQMNESGDLQRNVAAAAKDFESAIHDVASVVKTVDGATGSFKNTLKALLALKVASTMAGWADSFTGLSKSAESAATRTALLRANLRRLGAIGVITIGIEVVLHKKAIDKIGNSIDKAVDDALGHVPGFGRSGLHKALVGAGVFGHKATGEGQFSNVTGGAGQHGALVTNARRRAEEAKAVLDAVTPRTVDLTAVQRNTFFDNQIARTLLRGGLGDVQTQIAALIKANGLIADRIKVTKDVTRRLHLEDEILQNTAQIKSLRAQQAADALSKRHDVFNEIIANLQLRVSKADATASFTDNIAALKALQAGIRSEIKEFGSTADLQGQLFDVQQQIIEAGKAQKQFRLDTLIGKQFRQLGLTATGDEITPGVANLRKRLGQLTENITGTSLDTPKLRSQLARFRKVLSEGLVPTNVRQKIREMLDGISQELKDRRGPLTKTEGLDTKKLVAGLGLTPEQIRELRGRVSGVNSAGRRLADGAPAAGSFVGGRPIVVESHITVKLDAATLTKAVTRAQQKTKRRNPAQRRGPNRGG